MEKCQNSARNKTNQKNARKEKIERKNREILQESGSIYEAVCRKRPSHFSILMPRKRDKERKVLLEIRQPSMFTDEGERERKRGKPYHGLLREERGGILESEVKLA